MFKSVLILSIFFFRETELKYFFSPLMVAEKKYLEMFFICIIPSLNSKSIILSSCVKIYSWMYLYKNGTSLKCFVISSSAK